MSEKYKYKLFQGNGQAEISVVKSWFPWKIKKYFHKLSRDKKAIQKNQNVKWDPNILGQITRHHLINIQAARRLRKGFAHCSKGKEKQWQVTLGSSCISSHSLKHCSQRQESHRQGLFKDEAESICCSSQTPEMMRLRAVTFCPFRCAEHQQFHLHDDLSSPCFSELVNVLHGQHLPLWTHAAHAPPPLAAPGQMHSQWCIPTPLASLHPPRSCRAPKHMGKLPHYAENRHRYQWALLTQQCPLYPACAVRQGHSQPSPHSQLPATIIPSKWKTCLHPSHA